MANTMYDILLKTPLNEEPVRFIRYAALASI
jgi:hypothetical protein